MSTPRKNFGNYASPYAKACNIYPSQSEDYLSLNAGGPGAPPQEAPPRRRQGFSSTPAKYNRDSGFSQSNFSYFYQDSRGGATGGSGQKQNYYRNNYRSNDTGGGSSSRGNGNRRGYGRGGGGYQKHRSPASKEESFALYFHPTMLDDPWKDLIERLNAIRKSEVNLQSSKHEQENAGGSSSSEAENSNETRSSSQII